MTVVSYHSTLVDKPTSAKEAVDKTSSQILLSRGIAGPESESDLSPHQRDATSVVSIFESDSKHIMTLSEPSSVVHSISQKSIVTKERGQSFLTKISFNHAC
jgi:hypothetical protein